MAGWKLRKDKAQADAPETPEPSEDPALEDPALEDPAMPGWDTPAAGTEETFLPATAEATYGTEELDTEFDHTNGHLAFAPVDFEESEPNHIGGIIALGGAAEPPASEPLAIAPLPDFEMGEEIDFGEEVSFDDDEDETGGALIFHDPQPEAAAPAPEEARSEEPRDVPEVAPFVMDAPPPPPAPDLPHRLVMRIGKLSAAFDLVKDVTVIGRPDSALHFYPDMEVEMDDAVSRRHAEVLKSTDGTYSLMDSGSTNGTRLNGELLPPNEEHLLAHGDRIHIGERTEIVFE